MFAANLIANSNAVTAFVGEESVETTAEDTRVLLSALFLLVGEDNDDDDGGEW